MMQVQGAQFFRDPMPEDGAGPKVLSSTSNTRVQAGSTREACSGELDSNATAVAVGLASDSGYWIVRAGTPLIAAPNAPTFQFVYALAGSISPGAHEMVLRGVDATGQFGPKTTRTLDVVSAARPEGHLVISLTWDSAADLDLHVVLPSGIEIFKRNPTEYERPPPSAGPVPPNAPLDGGVLDRDSNAGCVLDGQREEDVVWTEAPPKGHYIVRVDTFSLCGAPSAHWRVEALLDGTPLGGATGTGTENDLRFEHNRGGGVLALEIDVP
jgi:hypothetical protein